MAGPRSGDPDRRAAAARDHLGAAGGLTDVEVTLTVTDTAADQTRQYFNELGAAFEPIRDTAAFDTCP